MDADQLLPWCTKCVPGLSANTTLTVLQQLQTVHDTETGWTAMAIIAITTGLVLCFFGYALFHASIFLIGFVAGTAFLFFLVCGWGSLLAASIAGLLFGLVCGSLAARVEKVGIVLCGAGGGLMLGLYLNGFVLHYVYEAIPGAQTQACVPYIVDAAFAIVGGALTILAEREIIITSTAISGAYFVGWGCLRVVSDLTDRVDRTESFSPIELFTGKGCHDKQCYIALPLCVCMGLLGAYVQHRRTSQKVTRFSRRSERLKLVDEDGNSMYVMVE